MFCGRAAMFTQFWLIMCPSRVGKFGVTEVLTTWNMPRQTGSLLSKTKMHPIKYFVCTDAKAWKFMWQGLNSKVCFVFNYTPNQMHKIPQNECSENVIFCIFRLKYGAHESEAVMNFHNWGLWLITRKKNVSTQPHLTVINSFYSGNETWKKYISNHYNNFICVSITFTNIYLTYKREITCAYKIYVDDLFHTTQSW